MFPALVPSIVSRIWRAALDLYRLNKSLDKLTVDQIVTRMGINDPDQPRSVETIRRARRTHPDLLPWPIKRGMQPPWMAKPEVLEKLIDATPVELTSADTLHLQTLEGVPVAAVWDNDGGFYRIVRWAGGIVGAMAAGYAAYLALDGMDGHFDHVIHWCLLAVGAAPHLHFL